MNGIIPLYKERGLTSHDCVNQLRKILQTKKVGHSGTLDPNVDGVLPICIGSATKVVDYLMEFGKTYRGTITLGFSTTTEDLDGEVVERTPLKEPVDEDKISAVMAMLTGEITQIPPMYSAVKVNGRKLYEYARAGETVERPARNVMIYSFVQLGKTRFDEETGQQEIHFEVKCSKGTYIRTLAVDFGRHLGLESVMSDLTRISSGGFDVKETVTIDEIKELFDPEQTTYDWLYPINRALAKYPEVKLTEAQWRVVQNGVWMYANELASTEPVIALSFEGEIKCLYQLMENGKQYKPLKMISNK